MKTKLVLILAFVWPALFAQPVPEKRNARPAESIQTAVSTAGSLNDILQKALYEEEANQDPQTAALLYQDIIRQVEQQRRTAALAHFRLGECYRKLGKSAEAAAQYDLVIKNYTDVEQIAAQAREARGNSTGSQPAIRERLNTVVAKASEIDPERARLERIIKNSPDLLNAPVKPVDGEALTYLQDAARNGDVESVKFLLQSGARVDTPSPGTRRTALHFAAGSGHKTAVELLIDSGAQVNAGNSKAETPLHFAARGGYLEVSKVLLAKGANPRATMHTGETPLHEAARQGHTLLAEHLLDQKVEINAQEQSGYTSLMFAVVWRHKDTTELLLARKADANVLTRDQPGIPSARSALSLAVEKAPELIPLLLEHGADPDTSFALHLTLALRKSGDEELVDMFLRHGADVNLQDANGKTPLHYAVASGVPSLVQKLLEAGADPKITDRQGRSPLRELSVAPESVRRRSSSPAVQGTAAPDIMTLLLKADPGILRDSSGLSSLMQEMRGAGANGVQISQELARLAEEHLAKQAANFELRAVLDNASDETVEMHLEHKSTSSPPSREHLHVSKTPLLTGDAIAGAKSEFDQIAGQTLVRVTFTQKGAEDFALITEAQLGKRIAILIDGKVISAPKILQKITSDSVQISGNFAPGEAEILATRLNAAVKKPKF